MKSLLLLIATFLVYHSAFAASFDRVNVMHDERLDRLVEIHGSLSHVHGYCGNPGRLQITARRLNEIWENTVKQAVYFSNTGVNAPVRNMKVSELDLRKRGAIDEFVTSAFTETIKDPTRVSDADRQALGEFMGLVGTLRGDYRFYVGGHQNFLGPATFAVIVDLVNAEVLVLQASFCE